MLKKRKNGRGEVSSPGSTASTSVGMPSPPVSLTSQTPAGEEVDAELMEAVIAQMEKEKLEDRQEVVRVDEKEEHADQAGTPEEQQGSKMHVEDEAESQQAEAKTAQDAPVSESD